MFKNTPRTNVILVGLLVAMGAVLMVFIGKNISNQPEGLCQGDKVKIEQYTKVKRPFYIKECN